MSVQSSAAAAVPAGAPAAPSLAARSRMALFVLLAVYPLVTALVYIIFPLTDGWQAWQRTLVLVPIMVVSLVFVVIPAIQRRFGRFIATGRS